MNNKHLIEKWLSDELSKEEESNFLLLEDASFFEEIIEEGQRFKSQNPTRVSAFEDLSLTPQTSTTKHLMWPPSLHRVAAVLVVSIGLLFWLGQEDSKIFETALAQTEQVVLPDNSIVKLNELSELTIQGDWEKERSVSLRGEAFFKVAKGKRFDVLTANGTVSVLGTQFNVSDRDGLFQVVCYEGLVQVIHNNNVSQVPAGKAYQLLNGQAALIDVLVIQPEWIQNMKVFREAKIRDVFDAVAIHYNIEIKVEVTDASMLFTGAFELDNLDNALEAITQTLNLTYENNGDNVITIRNEN